MTSDRNARARYVRALEAAWEAADDHAREYGPTWYGRALQTARGIAAAHPDTGATVEQVAGAIAAMSPRVSWHENVADTEALLDWWDSEPDDAHVPLWYVARGMRAFRKNIERAVECLQVADPLTVLRGPKQRAFYANIMGDTDGVTVDVWATRAATRGALDTPGRHYADIAAAYWTAARRIGIAPRDLQAAIWISVRSQAAHVESRYGSH